MRATRVAKPALRAQPLLRSNAPSGGKADGRSLVLGRLEQVHAQVFRADVVGELHAMSDGKSVTLTGERSNGDEAPGTAHVFPDDW